MKNVVVFVQMEIGKNGEGEIILADKPAGITSFEAVNLVKKKVGAKKAGHAGTLDPLATGLLIIGTERKTKNLGDFSKLPKRYEAEILFGVKTDTGDIDGKILLEEKPPEISESKIKKALAGMQGELLLSVPAFSAIKKNGVPLYKYARRGEKIEVPERKMTVFEAKLLATEPVKNLVKVSFYVSSGTYVRSLAEELGKRLGTVATLKNLRRISIGDFLVEDAEKI